MLPPQWNKNTSYLQLHHIFAPVHLVVTKLFLFIFSLTGCRSDWVQVWLLQVWLLQVWGLCVSMSDTWVDSLGPVWIQIWAWWINSYVLSLGSFSQILELLRPLVCWFQASPQHRCCSLLPHLAVNEVKNKHHNNTASTSRNFNQQPSWSQACFSCFLVFFCCCSQTRTWMHLKDLPFHLT